MGIRIGETKPKGSMVKLVLNPALLSQLQVGQRLLAIGTLDVSDLPPRAIGSIIRNMPSAVAVLEGVDARVAKKTDEVQLFIAPIDTRKFESLDLRFITLDQVPPDCRSRTVNRYVHGAGGSACTLFPHSTPALYHISFRTLSLRCSNIRNTCDMPLMRLASAAISHHPLVHPSYRP
jgi:hypothetical protein